MGLDDLPRQAEPDARAGGLGGADRGRDVGQHHDVCDLAAFDQLGAADGEGASRSPGDALRDV